MSGKEHMDPSRIFSTEDMIIEDFRVNINFSRVPNPDAMRAALNLLVSSHSAFSQIEENH